MALGAYAWLGNGNLYGIGAILTGAWYLVMCLWVIARSRHKVSRPSASPSQIGLLPESDPNPFANPPVDLTARPMGASLLSASAGLVQIAAGYLYVARWALLPPLFGPPLAYGSWNAAWGTILFFFGLRMFTDPPDHRFWGEAILLVSFMSITTGGGMVVGLVLGVIGGYLGVKWKQPLMPLNRLLEDAS